jgi:hypothetical protein
MNEKGMAKFLVHLWSFTANYLAYSYLNSKTFTAAAGAACIGIDKMESFSI